MGWLALTLSLIVAYLFQTTVFTPADWPVDLFLVVALVAGLSAPTPDARLAAWFSGLAADLGTVGPIGVHALALGLTGLLLTQLRSTVNEYLWWARFWVALLAAIPGHILILLHLRYFQADLSLTWMDFFLPAGLPIAAGAAALITQLSVFRQRRRRQSLASARR